MQYICHFLEGKVEKGVKGEYGKAELIVNEKHKDDPMISWMFKDQHALKKLLNFNYRKQVPYTHHQVWMSHQDLVTKLPNGFVTLGSTESCENAIISCRSLNVYAMQFHPEVKHTHKGKYYIRSLLTRCEKNWKTKDIIDDCKQYIYDTVPSDKSVVLGKKFRFVPSV